MFSFIIVVFALVNSFSSIYTLPQPVQSTDISGLTSLISSEGCNFYAALNTIFECGPKSHLMQYSYKYCERLVKTRNTFENVQYQDDARQCLQQKLADKIQKAAAGSITCDSFKQIDLDSHGSCLAVSFKTLSINDITQFITTFKDTTVNYAQLCRLANSFAGHWSQIVKGDLMSFVKKQLKIVFPDGDTTSCTIKENEIIEEIEEIITDVSKVLDQVKGIKDDIILIIEKAKAIRDDFKTIQETIKGIKNGSIPELEGIKTILEKVQSISNNAKIIIDTIKNLVKNKSNATTPVEGQENADFSRILQDLISIIDQIEQLKDEAYKVVDNVNTISDIIDNIREGKVDIFDGLIDIVNQVDDGVDNIYSIIETSYTLKATVTDLVDAVIKNVDEVVDDLIEGVEDKVDEVIGGAGDKVDEVIGGGIGGLGGIGK